MNEVSIRAVRDTDMALVYSTWLRSYRFNSNFAKKLSNKVYYEWHHKVIERLFGRGAFCLMACDASDNNIVFGYLVGERSGIGNIIHFIYIKKAFRGLGIMRQLLSASGLSFNIFSHYTEFCDEYLKKHEGMEYNPYVI